MPFVIYEQGVRIVTPPNSVFPPRVVEKLKEIEKTVLVSQNDQVKESREAFYEHGIEAYRSIDEGEPNRARIRYAEQLMSEPVQTVYVDDSIGSAWVLIRQNRFRHLPVLSRVNHLVGILSDRDIFSALIDNGEGVLLQQVDTLMQVRVLTATPKTEVRLIAGLMSENHIGSIPVVTEKGEVIGIVTTADLLRTLVNQAPLELWL